MKNIFTLFLLVLFFLFTADSFAGDPDSPSRKTRQVYSYGERILRIDYAGDSIYETYLLIPYDDGHNAVKNGVGYNVFHQDIDSKNPKIVSSFIGNNNRLIKKALNEKKSFTIKLVEKGGQNDGWIVVKESEVFLY